MGLLAEFIEVYISMDKIEYQEAIIGELKVDCYAGKNCDKHEKYWNVFAEGDMQDDNLGKGESFVVELNDHPPGTKVFVKEPLCPKCGSFYIDCKDNPNCNFSWLNFADELYS